jgi:lipid-A-disaccharide synthase
MEVADKLGCKVVVAGAPSRTSADYAPFIGSRSNVELIFGRTYDILKYAQAAIINSGTASLEAALIGTPQVVCWSTSAVTAFVARHILRVMDHISFISLGNLILDKEAFQELIQEDFTSDNVAAEIRAISVPGERRSQMLADYAAIRQALGGSGASKAIAESIYTSLREE